MCVLRTKIGLSKGRHNAGRLKGSHSCSLLSLSLYHTSSNGKKITQAHTSEHAVALTKWLITPRRTLPLSLPGFIRLPTSPSKWLAPPGACLACHPSSAVTLRQRWRSDGAPITAAIQFLSFSPPNKKNKKYTAARWLSLTLTAGGGGENPLHIRINQNRIRVPLSGPFYFPLTWSRWWNPEPLNGNWGCGDTMWLLLSAINTWKSQRQQHLYCCKK